MGNTNTTDKQLYPINYLGKVYNTTIHKDITDEEFESVKAEYYQKPDFKDVTEQFRKIDSGGVKCNHITNYYVKDLMAKVKIHFNNWTIEEALNYKPLIEFFAGKVNDNKKVYPDTLSLGKKIETAFRLCGFKTASKPSNFPLKTVNQILELYNVNGNYYDFSCGWGTRLLGALKNRVNYYGTDPNYILCERLRQMGKDYQDACNTNTIIDIKAQGSEIFIPELENKIGLAFSSPPYYNLEDYRIGNQSWSEGVSYEEWRDNYLRDTISNIYKYLINDGYFAININNFNKYNDYDLVGDTVKIAKNIGFELEDIHTLKNIKRCHGHVQWDGECGWNDNDEKIFIFKKKTS